MVEKTRETPTTGTEQDISKVELQQKAPTGSERQPEEFERGTLQSPSTGKAEPGFVAAKGRPDSSSELIEEEEDSESISRERE